VKFVTRYKMGFGFPLLALTALLSMVPAHAQLPEPAEVPSPFQVLLSESNLVFDLASDLQETEAHPDLNCNRSYTTIDRAIRVCIMVRPIGRMTIDYDDPHSSAPDPNQIYPLLFESLVNSLSDHRRTLSQAYSPDQAHELFGADWANAAAFDLREEFASKAEYGNNALLIASHKHQHADVYLLFTYRAPELAKARIPNYLSLLRFKSDDSVSKP